MYRHAFDAEGLTRLTEEIESRKKIRNDIEQDTMIAARQKNLEAEKIDVDAIDESGRPPESFEGGLFWRQASSRQTA